MNIYIYIYISYINYYIYNIIYCKYYILYIIYDIYDTCDNICVFLPKSKALFLQGRRFVGCVRFHLLWHVLLGRGPARPRAVRHTTAERNTVI